MNQYPHKLASISKLFGCSQEPKDEFKRFESSSNIVVPTMDLGHFILVFH